MNLSKSGRSTILFRGKVEGEIYWAEGGVSSGFQVHRGWVVQAEGSDPRLVHSRLAGEINDRTMGKKKGAE